MAEDKTSITNDEVGEASKSPQKETGETEEKETLDLEKTKETDGSKSKILGKMKHYRKLVEEERKRVAELQKQLEELKSRSDGGAQTESERLKREIEEIKVKQSHPDLESDDIDMARAIASSKGVSLEKAIEDDAFKNYLLGKKEKRRREAATPSPSGRSQKSITKDSLKEAQKTGDYTKVIEERLFPKKK